MPYEQVVLPERSAAKLLEKHFNHYETQWRQSDPRRYFGWRVKMPWSICMSHFAPENGGDTTDRTSEITKATLQKQETELIRNYTTWRQELLSSITRRMGTLRNWQ